MKTNGLLHIADLRFVKGKRLYLKLAVFDTPKNLRAYWKTLRGHTVDKGCVGVVNSFASLHYPTDKPAYVTGDKRYFAVMCLCKKYLSMEVVCHESVHAAFAFAKRHSVKAWEIHAKENDEESICYPAGAIAAAINRELFKHKLYE